MVRNRHLAKSISDAAWTQFRSWVEYFGKVFGVVTVAVPPHYTSQNCSNYGATFWGESSRAEFGGEVSPPNLASQKLACKQVKKALSVRTHVCTYCGHTQDRDWNAARNILEKALSTVGHIGTNASGETDQYLGSQRRAGVPPVEATGVEETPPSKSTRGKRKPKE